MLLDYYFKITHVLAAVLMVIIFLQTKQFVKHVSVIVKLVLDLNTMIAYLVKLVIFKVEFVCLVVGIIITLKTSPNHASLALQDVKCVQGLLLLNVLSALLGFILIIIFVQQIVVIQHSTQI